MSATHEALPVALPVGPQEAIEIPFWEGLRAGELRIQHCGACDWWIWSPSWICPKCHSFDPPWESVRPRGTVYSWTTTFHAFPASQEFRDAVPYTTALVELPDAGGRRLLGIVTGRAPVQTGARVVGWVQPASDLTGGWAVLRWTTDVEDQ
ncbi:Zn-ribbon domain-containing OB-fold protein [Mycobacterium sp.]|uniref:Zn-ribbon domain-containing OB-fold protein n=1 Tax=Mycobacterium sp. TaxID=1785 RepID=UPI003BAEA537